ncbi:hypothetical protein NL676_015158 [Syzygium grande]|nr:hypothetical protein NL676_015158 [Syzygium grande]
MTPARLDNDAPMSTIPTISSLLLHFSFPSESSSAKRQTLRAEVLLRELDGANGWSSASLPESSGEFRLPTFRP